MSTIKANRYENTASSDGGINIDSSGKVGINEASPSAIAHIKGAGGAASGNELLRLETEQATGGGWISFNDASARKGYMGYKETGNDGIHIFNEENSFIALGTNSAEQARLDSSGRLLVSTTGTDQDALLTVARTGDGGASPSTISTATVATFRATGGLSHEAHVSILGGSSGASRLNLGDRDDEDVASITYDHSNNFMKFNVNTSERMRITNHGRLDVFGSSSTDAMFISSGFSAGTAGQLLKGMHSATAIAGGTNAILIHTNGNIQNINGSYGSISDVKLKENIVDANSQWDDIKGIQVRNYNFKEETGHQTHTQIGVVAQEIETVSPGLVYETPDSETIQVPVLDENGEAVLDENGEAKFTTEDRDLGTVTKSVNYSVLYMKSVKALQEAMTRIETLEAKVAALEAA